MRIKTTKKDVIWNYVGTIFVMGTNFIILPILMVFLSSELIGLWQVFVSIGAIAMLLDFGFSPTIARNVAYVWSGARKLQKTGTSEDVGDVVDFDLLKRVLYTCRLIYLVLAIAALLLLGFGGSLYIVLISSQIADGAIVIAWTIYVFAVFLNLYYYYYTALLLGIGAVASNNKARVTACFFQIAICFVFAFLGFGIIAPATAFLCYGIVYRLLGRRIFVKKTLINSKSRTSFRESIQSCKELFLVIWHNAWRDGLVAVSNYMMTQMGTIIASAYFDLSITGVYSLSIQFVTAIGFISSSMFTAYQPQLQAAFVENNLKKKQEIVSISLVVYTVMYIILTIMLFVFGLPFLAIIQPDYHFDIPILIMLAIYMYFQKRYSIFTSYYSSSNRLPYVASFVISSIAGVALSAVLASPSLGIGVWGLALGQFVAQCVYNNWYWPRAAKNELQLNELSICKIGITKLREIIGRC